MKILNLQPFYTFFSHLSKREKLILYAAAIFIFLTMIDRLMIYPVASKMEGLNNEIQQKEAGIKKSLHILAQKDRILTESAKLTPFLSTAKSEDEELTSFLKEIEGLANKSSVYLVDMKPAGFKEEGSAKEYTINLNCEAQIEQLTEFMYNIENSNNLLAIDKYQLTPKSKESSVAKCSMSITKIVMP